MIDWAHFTPWSSLAGGILIGAAAAMLVLLNGRIAGVAGILGGVLRPAGGDVAWRLAFIIGLLISNSVIVVVTATGFVASQLRQRIYVAIGVVAGAFSIVVGLLFLLQAEQVLPDLDSILGFIGS